MAAGAIGTYFTAYGSFAGGTATVIWSGTTGGAITLPNVPSGTGGFIIPFVTSGNPLTGAQISAVTASGMGIANLAAGSGYFYAFTPHSMIA